MFSGISMTVIKRGGLAGLQVYLPGGVAQWTKKPLIFRNPPPWVMGVDLLSDGQLKAAYALARAAFEFAFGKRGKVRYKGMNLPIGAATVAYAVPKGAKVHGGMTKAERAEIRHKMAEVTIAYLESLLKTRGISPPSLARPAIPA
jgi:hypothetical protein